MVAVGALHQRLVERIGLVVIAVLCAALFSASVHFERKLASQKALFYQLQLLRTSIHLFKAIRHRNPHTLHELITETYRFSDETIDRRFLEYPLFISEGQFLDPFGKEYLYEPTIGWVRSNSQGYESW